jgi:endonuclease YncB( thermonuclease family)
MVLEFIKNCPPYVLGDIAGIKDKLAQKLIDGKYAIEYQEKTEEAKQTKINISEDVKENTEDAKAKTKNSKK